MMLGQRADLNSIEIIRTELGVLIINAPNQYDMPVVLGALIMIAAVVVLINIFVDVVYVMLDPRIREG